MLKPISLRCFFSVLLAVAIAPNVCQADLVFDFIQNGTGNILGTLELSGLPADGLDDVTGFSFTSAGDALYGFGEGDYTGTFNTFGGNLSNQIELGLDGNTLIATGSGSSSLVSVGSDATTFSATFGQNGDLKFQLNDDGSAGLISIASDSSAVTIANGSFVHSVPEPSSFPLLAATAYACFLRRRNPAKHDIKE